MSQENKYIHKMLDEANACERTAYANPFAGDAFDGYRANLLASAAEWRAGAEAYKAMLEALTALRESAAKCGHKYHGAEIKQADIALAKASGP